MAEFAEIAKISESGKLRLLETLEVWVFFGREYGISEKIIEIFLESLKVANLL